MLLRQVKEFNQVYLRKGSELIPFRIGNGGMYEDLRVKGWVVSGYVCRDSHKYFSNRVEALQFMATIDL